MINEKEKNTGLEALPPIRVDEEVADDEPHIETGGGKKASLPPPVPFNPREG